MEHHVSELVVVIGASGLVGSALCEELAQMGRQVVAVTRHAAVVAFHAHLAVDLERDRLDLAGLVAGEPCLVGRVALGRCRG